MVGPIASMDLQSCKSGCHHCAPAVLRAQDSQVHVAPLWRVRTCFGYEEEEVTCRGWNQKGKFSGTVTANYTVPMIATTAESMMKGARRSVRAATHVEISGGRRHAHPRWGIIASPSIFLLSFRSIFCLLFLTLSYQL